jgi:hypothetical protein
MPHQDQEKIHKRVAALPINSDYAREMGNIPLSSAHIPAIFLSNSAQAPR